MAQMGATVLLYNRYDQVVRQALTNDQGKFAFESLSPDLYSIRVTLASFVPAVRRNIAVAVGTENVLEINLANLLSTVDLTASGPSRGTLMTDDWKWVLRTSQATRPVLRFLPTAKPSNSPSIATLFSDTTGILRLSAGDGDSFTAGSRDLGTAFALATSIYGLARVQLSGNVGYAGNAGMPAAGFRTTYSGTHANGSNPQITLTVRQLYLPTRAGSMTVTEGAPALRTMSVSMIDKLELSENLHVDYGVSLESVSFFQRLNYVSPFVRATYDLDSNSSVRVAYSSGTEPTELLARGNQANADLNPDLNQNLTALSILPRVSMRDAQAHVQRTQTLEAGYQRVQGSRTYSGGVYHDTVANAAFTMSGAWGFIPATDALPDFGSSSMIFNAGSYQSFGISAAVTQSLGDHLEATVAAGRGGARGNAGASPRAGRGNLAAPPAARPTVAVDLFGCPG